MSWTGYRTQAVASSREDAWIETPELLVLQDIYESRPPARTRGLKRCAGNRFPVCAVASSREDAWIETYGRIRSYLRNLVASSREDAWIETDATTPQGNLAASRPPARTRGLKRPMPVYSVPGLVSRPPARTRGLKRFDEIHDQGVSMSRPPARTRGLKPFPPPPYGGSTSRVLPRGRVD